MVGGSQRQFQRAPSGVEAERRVDAEQFLGAMRDAAGWGRPSRQAEGQWIRGQGR
jgi:hypothetical protein